MMAACPNKGGATIKKGAAATIARPSTKGDSGGNICLRQRDILLSITQNPLQMSMVARVCARAAASWSGVPRLPPSTAQEQARARATCTGEKKVFLRVRTLRACVAMVAMVARWWHHQQTAAAREFVPATIVQFVDGGAMGAPVARRWHPRLRATFGPVAGVGARAHAFWRAGRAKVPLAIRATSATPRVRRQYTVLFARME